MPAFGKILSREDLELLAQYLRSGHLDGIVNHAERGG